MGGLWSTVPRMGAAALVLALASMGLPGLGNFVAEFLILLGTFQASPVMAVLAAAGLVFAAVYALWMMLKVFYGSQERSWAIPDLGIRETIIFAVLIVGLVWLGLKPRPVVDISSQALSNIANGPAVVGVVRGSETVKQPAGSPVAERTAAPQFSADR